MTRRILDFRGPILSDLRWRGPLGRWKGRGWGQQKFCFSRSFLRTAFFKSHERGRLVWLIEKNLKLQRNELNRPRQNLVWRSEDWGWPLLRLRLRPLWRRNDEYLFLHTWSLNFFVLSANRGKLKPRTTPFHLTHHRCSESLHQIKKNRIIIFTPLHYLLRTYSVWPDWVIFKKRMVENFRIIVP